MFFTGSPKRLEIMQTVSIQQSNLDSLHLSLNKIALGTTKTATITNKLLGIQQIFKILT